MSFKDKPDPYKNSFQERRESFLKSNPYRLLIDAETQEKKIQVATETLERTTKNVQSLQHAIDHSGSEWLLNYHAFLESAQDEQFRWLGILLELSQAPQPAEPISPIEEYKLAEPRHEIQLAAPQKNQSLTRSQSKNACDYKKPLQPTSGMRRSQSMPIGAFSFLSFPARPLEPLSPIPIPRTPH